jgi:hypothetical protein
VQNANGFDIAPFSDSGCTQQLQFEREAYVSSTGELVMWVAQPTLNTSTVDYLCYGNPSQTTDISSSSAPWSTNYAGVWHFAEGTGSSTKDSSGNHNTGTLLGGTSWSVSGPSAFGGDALQFTRSTTSTVDVSATSSLNNLPRYSWELWVNMSSNAFTNNFINKGQDNLEQSAPSVNGQEYGTFQDLTGTSATAQSTGTVYSPNTWYESVLTWNASSENVAIYNNGSLTASSTGSGSLSSNTSDLIFGGAAGTAASLNGYETEVRVAKVTLSPNWIATEYWNQSTPSTFWAMSSENAVGLPSISSFSASSTIVASAGTSTLSWNVSNATSIAITPGSFSTSTLSGSTTVNPTSTTIYTLTATNGNGTSTATTTVTVDSQPPTVPSSFTVTGTTTSTISLSWASSTDSGGAGLAGYKIYRGASSSSLALLATLATASTTYTDTNLATSTTYFYAVAAYDGVGNISAESTSTSATTLSGAPTISSFSASPSVVASAGASTLSWNITNASSVAITPGSFSTTTLIGFITMNPTSTTIYTLTTTNGNGANTATTTVTVDTTPPSVPSGLGVTTTTLSTAFLSWSSSTDSGGAVLAGYIVYRGNSTSSLSQVATTTNTTFTDTGLGSGTTYYYAVAAYDSVGNTSSQTAAIAATTANQIPSALLDNFTSLRTNASRGDPTNPNCALWGPYGGDQTYGISTTTFGTVSNEFYDTVNPLAISNITVGSSTVTITTATSSALTTGQLVTIGGVNGIAGANVSSTSITVLSSTQFTIPVTATGTYTGGGLVYIRGLIVQFFPYAGFGYPFPSGYLQNYIESGSWNSQFNRLSFQLMCNKNITRSPAGASLFQIGTYVKPHDDPDTSSQGAHFYHNFDPNLYDGQWTTIVMNEHPDHQVGTIIGVNWPNDPMITSLTTPGDGFDASDTPVHYFDGMTRFYVDGDQAGVGQANPNSQFNNATCYFANVQLENTQDEPDEYVGSLDGTYNGTGYEVGFNTITNSNSSYAISYSTSDLKKYGFNSGLSGGTVTSNDNDYTSLVWGSPSMSEKSTLYVGIRPQMQVIGVSTSTPMLVTLQADPTMAAGSQVNISGISGASAANGTWQVTPIPRSVFYTADGSLVNVVVNQPYATINTGVPHNLKVGQVIEFYGSTNTNQNAFAYASSYTITSVPSSTAFAINIGTGAANGTYASSDLYSVFSLPALSLNSSNGSSAGSYTSGGTEVATDNFSNFTELAINNYDGVGSAPSISSFSASSSIVASAGTSTLSWNVSNASSIAITPGSFSMSTLSGSTTVNPTSTTIYTLTATNGNGTSTATTTVTVATAPSPPQSLSATSGNTLISLSWSAPSSNGGSSLTQYLVYDRFTGSSTFALYATTTPSQTNATATSLTNAQSYDFEILAQNAFGTSTSSNIVSSTPFAVPNSPTSIFATAGNAEATISFTPGSSNGSTILYYTATSNPGNISATSTVSPVVVTSLTNGQSYAFTVSATNAAGASASSSASNSVTPNNLDPGIGSFAALPAFIKPGASSTLSWGTTLAATVSINQGVGNQSATSSGSTTVSPSSTTVYLLTATNSNGTSTAQTSVTVDGTPPSIPTNLIANAISTNEVNLSWLSSTDNVGVAGYDIYRNSTKIATTSALSYEDTGLSANTLYMYTVDAFDAAGNISGESSSTSATTQSSSGGGGGSVGVSSGGGRGGSYVPIPSASIPTMSSTESLHALLNSLTLQLNALLLQAKDEGISVPSIGTAPFSFAFTRDLQLHDTGNDVKVLQEFLNSKGFIVSLTGPGSPGNESTYFGSKTWDALVKFQKSVGIHATGYFGWITRRWVNSHNGSM